MPVTPHPDRRTGPATRTGMAVVLLALLLGGMSVWLDRGVVRGATESKDFTMIYAGARLWFAGGNPYDFEMLYDAFRDGGGTDERPRDPAWFTSLYPPTTYAVLAPLGAMPWPAARVAMLGLGVVAQGVIAVALWRWRPRPRGRAGMQAVWSAGVLLSAWLWFAPAHTTLRFGQPGLVTLALVLLAVGGPGRRPAPWLAGLLLAVAGAIKPQLVGLFMLALLPVGRWRDVVWCVALGLGIVGLSAARLAFTAPTWPADLRRNLADFTGTGFADPTPANPYAWQMINLQPLLHRFTDSGTAVTLGVAVLVLAALAVVIRTTRGDSGLDRLNPGDRTLTLLSIAAALSLLVTYHRAYDAVLLAIPGVWAWRRLAQDPRGARAWVVAAAVAVFMLPGGSILRTLIDHGRMPESLRASWLGGTFVMLHANWALLLMLTALLAAHPRPRTGPAAITGDAPPAPAPPDTATPA